MRCQICQITLLILKNNDDDKFRLNYCKQKNPLITSFLPSFVTMVYIIPISSRLRILSSSKKDLTVTPNFLTIVEIILSQSPLFTNLSYGRSNLF